MSELPSAQEVLAIIAAEHSPYEDDRYGTRRTYCSACSHSVVVPWPCRTHRTATQRTRDLAALGMREVRGTSEQVSG